jgi:hypothetical protein
MKSSTSFVPSYAGRVVAFATTWSTASLDAIRARLRSLGAELIVFADDGEYRDDIAADLATASALIAARAATDAVFVLDGARAVRVGQGAATLREALDAAAELLVNRRLAASTTPPPFSFLHRWSEVLP